MAFDRSRRFVKLTTSTSTYVGPGTYDIMDLSKKPLRDPDNAYPFLSGTSRRILDIPKDVHRFPGPGSYNIGTPRKRIPERAFSLFMSHLFTIFIHDGVSMKYTDVRFKKRMYEGPGPTEYILPDDLFKQTPKKIRSHPGTWRGPAGKLWLIRPPRPIMSVGLSVFTKRDFSGYDYDKHGTLVKIPVIEHKPTDFYNVPREETNFTTLKYKGNFWSRMKGRDDERTSVTPGPGHYEHETKKSPAQIHDERTREAKRAAAEKPHFLDALQKLHQNFPAPNHYDPPKSVFDKYKRISCKCDPYTVQPPFNQTATRFENFQTDIPGPGTYEIRTQQICYGSILNAPFGALNARFKKIITVTPGPGDYHTDVRNLAFESAKRFKEKHQKMTDYQLFCKTPTLKRDDDKNTLTDEYEVADERKYAVYHAVFKSRVDRFPKIHKKDDVPDPGTYNVLSAFKTNRDKCDFLRQRFAPPFGSRASRFPIIREDVDFHVLGPSPYDLRGDISKNVKSGVICYASREKKENIEGPGPLHYHERSQLRSIPRKLEMVDSKTFTEL